MRWDISLEGKEPVLNKVEMDSDSTLEPKRLAFSLTLCHMHWRDVSFMTI